MPPKFTNEVHPTHLSLTAWKQGHLHLADFKYDRGCVSVRAQLGEGCSRLAGRELGCGPNFSFDVPLTLDIARDPCNRAQVQLSLVTLRIGCSVLPLQSKSKRDCCLHNASRAAALLWGRLVYPAVMQPVCHALVYVWCSFATARAGASLMQWRNHRRHKPTPERLCHPLPALKSVRKGLQAAARLVRRYGEPAAFLGAAAWVWAAVHPSSEQIGRCLAALVPVLAGYNQTARMCMAGLYQDGTEREQAWHRRHKWAAQQLAPFMTSLPPSPPLRPLLDAWESLDISIGLAVPGSPLGGSWGTDRGLFVQGFSRGGLQQLGVSVRVRPHGQGSAAGWTNQRPAQQQQAQQAEQRPWRAWVGRVRVGALGRWLSHRRLAAGSPGGGVDGQRGGVCGSGGPVGSTKVSEHTAAVQASCSNGGWEDGSTASASGVLSAPGSAHAGAPQAPPPSSEGSSMFGGSRHSGSYGASRPGPAGAAVCSINSSAGASLPPARCHRNLMGQGLPPAEPPSPEPLDTPLSPHSPPPPPSAPPPPPPMLPVDQHIQCAAPLHPPVGTPAIPPREEPCLPGDSRLARAAPGTTQHSGPISDIQFSSQGVCEGGAACEAGGAPPVNPQDRMAVLPIEEGAAPVPLPIPPTALYGRADHAVTQHADSAVGLTERCHLTLRGLQLLWIFAPFLLLGSALLLLAALLPAQGGGAGGRGDSGPPACPADETDLVGVQVTAAQGCPPGAVVAEGVEIQAEEVLAQCGKLARSRSRGEGAATWLGRVLAKGRGWGVAAGGRHPAGGNPPGPVEGPVPGSATVMQGGVGGCQGAGDVGGGPGRGRSEGWEVLGSRLRLAAFRLLLRGCRRSGAAFIKWGQWASTREDIFPEDMCSVLSQLHDQAPRHSYSHTAWEVQRALGRPVEQVFEWFDPEPLASGSIAQVHRATLRLGGRVLDVAVKVRHPGVAHRIWQDFQVLRPVAGLTSRIPSLKGLQLRDTLMQFSHTMTAQTDLRVEAEHMRRFAANFRDMGPSVVIPKIVPELLSDSVLVESFEAGQSVAHYMRSAHPRNAEVVALGVDAYLQMLLRDNFVHTDLHPGNILVRTSLAKENGELQEKLQIVLLDFGLAEELNPTVRNHFISFLNMIAKGDGAQAAEHLLQWSEHQQCPQPALFAAECVELFNRECNIHSQMGIDLDRVMKSVLHLARKHEVTIDSNYAALVVGICVLVGFAASLDPGVNLMDAATPCLLCYSLTGRVLGRLYM